MMRMNKVVKNAGASSVTQIINIIINFILPPLIIGTYGSQINGLVLTVKQILAYISLVGAGISIATTQSLYKPIAEKDYEKTSGMFNAASSMFSKAGYIFALIALITAFVYPFFLRDSIDYYLVVMIIIVMSIEGISEFFVVGKSRTLLFADQKSYVTSIIQAIGLVLSFIFAFLLIKANVSIVLVQLASSLVFMVRVVLLTWYIKKHYKYLNSQITPIKSAIKKRNDAFIHQITGLVVLGSQAMVLSVFVGLEAASIYAVYNVIFAGLHSICAQLVNSVAPFLGRSLALGENRKLLKQFNNVEFLYTSLLSLFYSVCIVMIIPFISIYVGEISDVKYTYYGVAVLFVLVSFLNAFRLPAQAAINIAGHFKETRWRAIIEAVICIVLQLLFVNIWGIYGVLIGTAIALSWRAIDIVIYSNKYIISQNSKTSFIRGLKVIIVMLMLMVIEEKFLHVNVTGYFEWIYWAVVYSIISILIIFLVNILLERKMLFNTILYIYNTMNKKPKKLT